MQNNTAHVQDIYSTRSTCTSRATRSPRTSAHDASRHVRAAASSSRLVPSNAQYNRENVRVCVRIASFVCFAIRNVERCVAVRTVSGRLAEFDVRDSGGDEHADGGDRLEKHEARVRRLQRERVARVRNAQLLDQLAAERQHRLLCNAITSTRMDTCSTKDRRLRMTQYDKSDRETDSLAESSVRPQCRPCSSSSALCPSCASQRCGTRRFAAEQHVHTQVFPVTR